MGKKLLQAAALCLWLVFLASPGPAQEGREAWAYPGGVLVTQDGGTLKELRKAPARSEPGRGGDDTEAIDYDPTRKALAAAATASEASVRRCTEQLRNARPELGQARRGWTFTLRLSISEQGRIGPVEPGNAEPPAELVECIARAMVTLAAQPLPARADGKVIKADVRYEVRMLDDDEAKGRGFQFFSGEKAFERILAQHPEWFRCRRSEDCSVTAVNCELRAVRRDAEEAYRKAAEVRRKDACGLLPSPVGAGCVSGRCRLQRGR